jgi:hypothetical protein
MHTCLVIRIACSRNTAGDLADECFIRADASDIDRIAPAETLPTQACYGNITIFIRLCDFEGR